MTKYRVVCGRNLEELIERVQVGLNAGWECQGGLAFYVSESDKTFRMYYQAMVRK